MGGGGTRRPRGTLALPDAHLWTEVARSVSPLRRRTLKPPAADEPATDVAAHAPARSRTRRTDPPPAARPAAEKTPAQPLIEPNLRKKLVRGHIEIDGVIDLHGLRQTEAHAALSRFVRARAERGDRTLLVITGKGLTPKAPEDKFVHERITRHGVLRAMLPHWLAEPHLKPFIAGLDAASRAHGGEGAFYIRLRRPR